MLAYKGIRNFQKLRHHSLLSNAKSYAEFKLWKLYSSGGKGIKVTLGDVSIVRPLPKNPELVPVKYLSENILQSSRLHLRWIMQKDILGQDVFLIGPPGPLKRQLAMRYLELTKKEVEYLSLSRDTTESDIKQRREIKDRTTFYIDECAVRAAIEGRTLVLEGIEKAERNVLPILNNLLENREMQLEDGRFLMSAQRYDKLLQEHSKEELDSWKVVRVSENFRVIALGLPIPRFQGNPLDPPLRSRFQARDINSPPFKELMDKITAPNKQLSEDKIRTLLSFAYTTLSPESIELNLPPFPVDQLADIVKVMETVPNMELSEIIHRLYPYELFLEKDGQNMIKGTLKDFDLLNEDGQYDTGCRLDVNVDTLKNEANVKLETSSQIREFSVVAGTKTANSKNSADDSFVFTEYHNKLLSDLILSHVAKDFCIIGPKGCGKTTLVKKFADTLGYDTETVMLYQDMTARDLLQQRTTLDNGDTVWRNSALVKACLSGKLAVLDGLHFINPGTISVLHRLVHDRELQLFSGQRLLRADRYDKLKKQTNQSDSELLEKGILRIHPSFRVIALAEPPVPGSSTQQWLSPEMLSLFLYHQMRTLSVKEELQVIEGATDNVPLKKVATVLQFASDLRNTADITMQQVAESLSTRQLLRISRRLSKYPDESAYDAVQKACLARFLPPLTKLQLDKALESFGISHPSSSSSSEGANGEEFDKAVTCEVKNNVVRIGKTTIPVYSPDTKTKVPDVLFYDNAQHLSVMEDMLKDFMLGEHLLLVGNQGVGKNKIVDRFLHLLCRPREYIQLHRDTTIQTLTLQPSVHGGVIVYEDSPLVRAVKLGHVLVIDEADKAPTHVTSILKALVESGSMTLADGRKIVSEEDYGYSNDADIIRAHPDFRMIVLANRPGFPFLGNDFFASLGDIFSCHSVDNPSMESEIEMLSKYGPDVPKAVIKKLVEAFGDLRLMADQGLIAYPYSTREVVNIVKHLQEFPNEGLATVVENVFDFDQYNKETWETLQTTLHKHGIPIGTKLTSISLGKEFPLPPPKLVSHWNLRQFRDSEDRIYSLPFESSRVEMKKARYINVSTERMDRTDARSLVFNEQQSYWELPMQETNLVVDLAVTKSGAEQGKDTIHVATANPITLFSMIPDTRVIHRMDLYSFFQPTRGGYQPQIKLAPLGGGLAGKVVVHEEILNKMYVIETSSGLIQEVKLESFYESASKELVQKLYGSDKGFHRMCPTLSEENVIVLYQNGGSVFQIIHLDKGITCSVTLPLRIGQVLSVSKDGDWLVTEKDNKRKYLLKAPSANLTRNAPFAPVLHRIEEGDSESSLNPTNVSTMGLRPFILSEALEKKIDSPNRIMSTSNDYAVLNIGFPELDSSNEIHAFERPKSEKLSESDSSFSSRLSPTYLMNSGQVVNAVPADLHPDPEQSSKSYSLSGFLEVVDLRSKKLRYLPVPGPATVAPYSTWMAKISPVNLLLAKTSTDGLVTVDAGGCVRLWETGLSSLDQALAQWRKLIGMDPDRLINVEIETGEIGEFKEPKHGQEDPQNAPHIGGGNWAGGVGGRGTAGLGGAGGPYRLDAGHTVHQVSDEVKQAVPEEVRKAARLMAKKAYKERLKQIQMAEHDAELYEKFSGNVRKQVQLMKVILDSLQAKSKERQWLRHQTSGELDDMKLIEGLTGEKSIYKRRGEHEPELGAPQQKPKRLKLVVDVSGSMYRFDGFDGRLQRTMEAALLMMEAFEKYDERFKYEIVGHSGEDYDAKFVDSSEPPKNNKQRLDILKMMHAHAQFCISGDNTLEATQYAVTSMAKEEADERFVVVLSDANLDRYGIRPSSLAKSLTLHPDVHAYAIFIGSLGDQAVRLTRALPSGRGFVCLDTRLIPDILKQIFTSTILSK